MDTPVNRVVYKERYGVWVNKLEYADEPCSTHYTQLAAIASAKTMLAKEGGGILTIRNLNGRIQDRIEVDVNSPISITREEHWFK